MQIDLSGKVTIITGATGELGRVMARTLAECGSDIAIHYLRNQENAQKLLKEIGSMGRRAVAVQADVTDFESVSRMRDKVMESLGAPDIVVNNAVIQYQWKNLLDQDFDDYESQFRSCVMQNVHMAKAFVPLMIPKQRGRFIGINTECAIAYIPVCGGNVIPGI